MAQPSGAGAGHAPPSNAAYARQLAGQPAPAPTRWAEILTPSQPLGPPGSAPPRRAAVPDQAPAGATWPQADPEPGVRPTLRVAAGLEGPPEELADEPGADAADDRSDPLLYGDYWLGYVLRPFDLVTAPLRWDTEDWIASGLVAGLGVGLYLVEEDVQDWIQDNKSGPVDRISEFVEPFGHKNVLLSTIGAGYLAGFVMDDRKIEETALLAGQGVVLALILTEGIKKLARRARPASGREHDAFDGPKWHSPGLKPGRYQKSLPSGHASNAFAVATVVASEYDNLIVQVTAYGLATGVA